LTGGATRGRLIPAPLSFAAHPAARESAAPALQFRRDRLLEHRKHLGRGAESSRGVRRTLLRRLISMVNCAVMPGFNLSSGFGTEITVE
jgi:hypothetical protein